MIVIVLGMHRSGTSTVAGILHLNKISMGTYQSFWPRPLPQNPKGFYENFDFRKINDLIMKNVHYQIKSYNPDIPTAKINQKLENKMIKVINKYESDFEFWGWKDPRTCLTISHWINCLDALNLRKKIKIIYITRKSSSVARSLKKRNNLPLNQGLMLWKSYSEIAVSVCEKNDIPVLYMSFEQILNSPANHFGVMFKFLDRPFSSSIIDDFVDKKISKSGDGEELELPIEVANLERKIEKLIST